MSQHDSMDLDHYSVTARPLADGDLPRLHELTVGVGWPHRTEDLRLLMSVAQGYVACDEIGRVSGSALWFPMGDDAASIGMVITTPRMQSRGAGRWLMELVLRDAGDREIVLNATPQGIRLYEQLGFHTTQIGHQRQGEALLPPPAPPPAGLTLRALTPADLPALLALDGTATGHDRQAALQAVLPLSDGVGLEDGSGALVGYALSRVFGRGQLIGPLVARTDAEAMALAAHFVTAHAGQFLRLDTLVLDGPFAGFLDRCGLPVAGSMTHMWLNPRPRAATGQRSYAMISQALN